MTLTALSNELKVKTTMAEIHPIAIVLVETDIRQIKADIAPLEANVGLSVLLALQVAPLTTVYTSEFEKASSIAGYVSEVQCLWKRKGLAARKLILVNRINDRAIHWPSY